MNDVKRDLTVVEIVYGESMMAACLLDLFRTSWLEKTTLEMLRNCLMLLSVEFR